MALRPWTKSANTPSFRLWIKQATHTFIMKIRTHTQTISTLAALAGLALAAGSAHAANMIVNGDFETGGAANTVFVDADWTPATMYHHQNEGNLTTKYLYAWGTQSVEQDVSAAWTTADAIDISLDAVNVFGQGGAFSVLVELRKASDNTVLWDSTSVSLTTTVSPLSWSIDASTLAAIEGEDLNLKITGSGAGAGIDNVSLEFNPVPEPSTTALLGLGGLALILRRRK